VQGVVMKNALCFILAAAGMMMADMAQSENTKSFYDLKTATLEGDLVSLSEYRGKVALVVNVASRCGFTGQYRDLQALYEELKDEGFVVLAFPSNDFGGQEPGTPQQIREFCSAKFNVTFPMFEKVRTKGDGQSDVFTFLTREHPAPKWNFNKYVVGRDGKVVAHFGSMTSPHDKKLIEVIKAELAKSPPRQVGLPTATLKPESR
jgi:glutathione peroxidase